MFVPILSSFFFFHISQIADIIIIPYIVLLLGKY